MLCAFCSTRAAVHFHVPTLFGLETHLCSTCYSDFRRTREFPKPARRLREPTRRLRPLPGQLHFNFAKKGGHGTAALEL